MPLERDKRSCQRNETAAAWAQATARGLQQVQADEVDLMRSRAFSSSGRRNSLPK